MKRPLAYSLAHRRVVQQMRSGYRLAYDPLHPKILNHKQGAWWLTDGKGPMLVVAHSVARRLVQLGMVREQEFTPDIVYFELSDQKEQAA
jgi:hypothetical protein